MQPHITQLRRKRIAQAAALLREGPHERLEGRAQICTGAAEIDGALPWGGLPPGLHEIAAAHGDAAGTGFAVNLIGQRPGPVLWCRSRRAALETGDPYGPGIIGLGLSPDRLILVEAARPAELLWAMEEAARTRGLAAVVANGVMPDLTASRRLQLAAEAGGGLVFLLPTGRQSAPSTALTRWFAASAPSRPEADGPGRPRWTIELWRCRGGGRPQDWMVEWDDAALSLSVVSEVADRPLAAADDGPVRPPGPDGKRPGRNPADGRRSKGGAAWPVGRDDIGGRESTAA
jgi:protein ImuA